jgi:alpha-aminoadipate/glutamate carrier protein LysW
VDHVLEFSPFFFYRRYTYMIMCECPICDAELDLGGCEENDLIECSECGTKLEIVSLTPPVLEEIPEEDEE